MTACTAKGFLLGRIFLREHGRIAGHLSAALLFTRVSVIEQVLNAG